MGWSTKNNGKRGRGGESMKVNKGELKETKERWSLITKERERIEGTKNNLFFFQGGLGVVLNNFND